MADIQVSGKTFRYPVVIGNKIEPKLADLVRERTTGNRLFIIADANFYALHGERLLKRLKQSAKNSDLFVLPSGEQFKNQQTLDAVYKHLLSSQISRSDFILAVGGGVTTDIVGYAAATVLRGVKWGAVPTTLLGMVDAAIGGKTGINHPLGKNLIGAIWQPSFVFCDQQYLQTLPVRQMVAGYGEILKYAGLAGGPMLNRVTRLFDGKVSATDWITVIRECCAYKAKIVSQDEREQNIRAYLNLGHTFGHAIEKSLGYGKLLHGEAVIVGLLGAICLSMLADPKQAGKLKDYYRLALSSAEIVPKRKLAPTDILSAMALDKKRQNQELGFVLLKQPGKPYIASGLPHEMIRFAVEQMIADYSDYGGKYAPHIGR
ncbi:MAG: 3-dehydroquinate synthase [bacterium]|nr:3-dehydroquinate synthase [bacterium]